VILGPRLFHPPGSADVPPGSADVLVGTANEKANEKAVSVAPLAPHSHADETSAFPEADETSAFPAADETSAFPGGDETSAFPGADETSAFPVFSASRVRHRCILLDKFSMTAREGPGG